MRLAKAWVYSGDVMQLWVICSVKSTYGTSIRRLVALTLSTHVLPGSDDRRSVRQLSHAEQRILYSQECKNEQTELDDLWG
jgi:hypothetical protein